MSCCAGGRILAAQRFLHELGEKGGLSAVDLAAQCSAHGLDAQKLTEQAEGVRRVGCTSLFSFLLLLKPLQAVRFWTPSADAGRDERR